MLRELFGTGVAIYRTCKQKTQRHHYLCSEETYVEHALEDYRNQMPLEKMKEKYRGMKQNTQTRQRFGF